MTERQTKDKTNDQRRAERDCVDEHSLMCDDHLLLLTSVRQSIFASIAAVKLPINSVDQIVDGFESRNRSSRVMIQKRTKASGQSFFHFCN